MYTSCCSIFMTALPLSQRGRDVALPPDATPAAVAVPDDQIVLEYTSDRRVSVNKQAVTVEELETRLREIYRARHNKTLFIIGASSLRYADIVEVIDAAKEAGVDRVGIVTERMRKRSGGS